MKLSISCVVVCAFGALSKTVFFSSMVAKSSSYIFFWMFYSFCFCVKVYDPCQGNLWYILRERLKLSFCHKDIQLIQYHLLKRLSCLHRITVNWKIVWTMCFVTKRDLLEEERVATHACRHGKPACQDGGVFMEWKRKLMKGKVRNRN